LETVVTPEGLSGGLNSLLKAVEAIESLCYPVATCLGEPQLGKYNLYPSLSTKNQKSHVRDFIDVLTWADGKHTNLEIADIMSKPIEEINSTIEILKHANLIKIQDYF
jgi:aminopeptidase-like protein